jgi:hypothetical protein
MDRGHLIGHQFGGSDSKPANIVSQYMDENQRHFYHFEETVRKAVNKGDCVAYQVTPIYTGASVIPSEIHLTAVGHHVNLHVKVPNVPAARRTEHVPPPAPTPHFPVGMGGLPQ